MLHVTIIQAKRVSDFDGGFWLGVAHTSRCMAVSGGPSVVYSVDPILICGLSVVLLCLWT